jgi:hypothetical protein
MTKIFKGWQAQIWMNDFNIGNAESVNVTVDQDLESYYGVDNVNPIKIIPGDMTITGSMKKAWMNVYYLSLLCKRSIDQRTFGFDGGIDPEFDLTFISAQPEIGYPTPVIYLYNCRFTKGHVDIPQDGWLVEDYDFTARRIGLGEAELHEFFDIGLDTNYYNPCQPDTVEITVNGHFYNSFPNTDQEEAGDYTALCHIWNASYEFDYWETTGGIAVDDIYANPCIVTVTGNGTLKAYFKHIEITFESRHLTNPCILNQGKIGDGSYWWADPLPYTCNWSSGSYTIEWNKKSSSFTFHHWETTGEVTVVNPNVNHGTMVVTGSGTLIAVYCSCPTGQQFVNPGFETGSFTGWTQSGWNIWTGPFAPHSGTYFADTQFALSWLMQTFSSPIPVSCFGASSVLGFWLYGFAPPHGYPATAVVVRLTYDDASYTDTTISVTIDCTWQYWNLKTYLTSGKNLSSVTITCIVCNGYCAVDDFTAIPGI